MAKKHYNLLTDEILFKKAKVICILNNTTIKEMLNKSLEQYVAKYEYLLPEGVE